MAILCIAICKKDGTPIVSRSFYEMAKARIEGLLCTFPRLISTGQQHTYVEKDEIRYLYHPLETLYYVVLITSKQSNILQDMQILQSCTNVINEICPAPLKESSLLQNKFEISFAFDEAVQPLSIFSDSLTIAQFERILTMESQDEIIENAITQRKEKEAKEQQKLKIKQIEMQKREIAKKAAIQNKKASAFTSSNDSYSIASTANINAAFDSKRTGSKTRISDDLENGHLPYQTATKVPIGKGLKLSRKPKSSLLTDQLVDQIATDKPKEESLKITQADKAVRRLSLVSPAKSSPRDNDDIYGTIEESLLVQLNRDGDVSKIDVKGSLSLLITDASLSTNDMKIFIEQPVESKFLQIKAHPNIDKTLLSTDNCICMKDQTKNFPCNQNLGLLKWKFATKELDFLPLIINCWISNNSSNGMMDVTIEYECKNSSLLPVRDLIIKIPVSTPDIQVSPQEDTSEGLLNEEERSYNYQTLTMDWNIPIVDKKRSNGCFAFSFRSYDPSTEIFPTSVSFSIDKSVCGFDILRIIKSTKDTKNSEIEKELVFSKRIVCSTEKYTVESHDD